jgi:hypothetical protein
MSEQPTEVRISFIQKTVCQRAQDKYVDEIKAACEALARTIRLHHYAQGVSYTERAAWDKDFKALIAKAVAYCLPNVRKEGAEAFLRQFALLVTSIPELQAVAYEQGQSDDTRGSF